MENSIKCFDVACDVIDEATKELGSGYREDSAKKKELERYCAIIDDLSNRFDGDTFEVKFIEKNRNIVISLTCSAFEINPDDRFYEIMRGLLAFGFKAAPDIPEYIQFDFTFEGVWVSNDEPTGGVQD